MKTKEINPKVFLTSLLSQQDSSSAGPGRTLLKLLVLGLEFLILQGQINGVLEDSSQQTAVMMFCGHSLFLPQLLPSLEYLCPDSEVPIGPSALAPT